MDEFEAVLADEQAQEDEKRFDFGDALRLLQGGFRVAREGWNGKGMWLALQVPDNHSKMRLPYLYMSVATPPAGKADLVPWLASQTDMLSDDWVLVAE